MEHYIILLTHHDHLQRSSKNETFLLSLWVYRHDDQGRIGHHGYRSNPVHDILHAGMVALSGGSRTSRECRATSRSAPDKTA